MQCGGAFPQAALLQGLPQSLPQGLLQGLPQGLQGLPQGLQGLPQGLPQALPQTLPQGLPQGLPQSLSSTAPAMTMIAPGAGVFPANAAPMLPGANPLMAAAVGAATGVPGPPEGNSAPQMHAMMNYQQLLQQQQTLMASQMMMQAAQAYEQEVSATLEAEVLDLQKHFNLDERITKDLDVQLKKRNQVEDDMKDLWEILEGARNPAGLLRVKIREMEEGVFRGTATPDRDVEEIAKKFKLDAQASAKLAEVLGKRDDRKKDLRQLCKHLELSNKPSSLVMLMLKDLRAGLPIKDPEYPAAVGSYRHKMGLKGTRRSRSRSRGRRKRRSSSDSSSSPPPPQRSTGVGPLSSSAPVPKATGPRAMTLLERFG
mmetsp:Transcript_116823/g.330513  ORF Transcript_116823/g.330513 Transcript_116823/m.330513 type:complete len:371 (+) Transcript_116823:116-1228(+)